MIHHFNLEKFQIFKCKILKVIAAILIQFLAKIGLQLVKFINQLMLLRIDINKRFNKNDGLMTSNN